MVDKRDPALPQFVGEMKLIEHFELIHRLQLSLLARLERIYANVRSRKDANLKLRRRETASHSDKRGRKQNQYGKDPKIISASHLYFLLLANRGRTAPSILPPASVDARFRILLRATSKLKRLVGGCKRRRNAFIRNFRF